MDEFIVRGGAPLVGSVSIAGAKNAVLPILAATLLSKFPICLRNVPDLNDVRIMNNLLISMGSVVQADFPNATLRVNTRYAEPCLTDFDLVSKMRASILVLGPLLARFGRARVALPGGCAIGSRPVDLHISALRRLGASISVEDGYIDASVVGRLQGADIHFDTSTVTGTENILMAAVLAVGRTVLHNAATEPEVGDLARCLNSMGAKISGIDTSMLVIEGVLSLNGVDYSVIPDRIEAGTYLAGALMTSGIVKVKKIQASLLSEVLAKMREAGGIITTGEDWIQLDMQGRRPCAVDFITAPAPGFPTDMQAQMLAVNTIALGESCVTESIFENRFMHVRELVKMGANISIVGDKAYLRGVSSLHSAKVQATDLRASASLVLAACCAKGETVIQDIYHIDRGYERIEKKLTRLGVNIHRVARREGLVSHGSLDCGGEFV